MKTLQELAALREKAKQQINIRKDRENGIRVVVGMATCGIAAGARPVLQAFIDEVSKRSLSEVTVAQTGCIGVCRLEPVVEIYTPGQDKVTYIAMTAEKVARIVNEHLVNGKPVLQYTIGSAE